jgi:hypothetical protein
VKRGAIADYARGARRGPSPVLLSVCAAVWRLEPSLATASAVHADGDMLAGPRNADHPPSHDPRVRHVWPPDGVYPSIRKRVPH